MCLNPMQTKGSGHGWMHAQTDITTFLENYHQTFSFFCVVFSFTALATIFCSIYNLKFSVSNNVVDQVSCSRFSTFVSLICNFARLRAQDGGFMNYVIRRHNKHVEMMI